MDNKLPVGIILFSVLIFIASFLSWGTFRFTPPPEGTPAQLASLMNEMQKALSINGWQGHLTVLGLTIPNWMVVVSGVGVGILALLRFAEIWDVPRGLLIAMSVLGIAHSGVFSFIMLTKATIGIGSLLTFACFIGLLVQTVMMSEHARPAVMSNPSIEYSPLDNPRPVQPAGPNPLGSMPAPQPGNLSQTDNEHAGVPGDPFYEWRQKRESE